MRYILGGLTLPRHAQAEENPDSTVGKVVTMNGTLGVDVQNTRRTWEITMPVITLAEWQAINALYKSQFAGSGPFLTFEAVPEAYDQDSIPETTVFFTPSRRKILWGGSYVDGYALTLEEENADS